MTDISHLEATIRMDPELRNSPGYQQFWTWLLSQKLEEQGWPIGTYSKITVWTDPLRGSIAAFDLDAGGDRIPDGAGGYLTREVAVTLASVPINSGSL